MKRIHIHTSTNDLPTAIEYYSALFATPPTFEKPDYAKWLLDDPRVNFSVSNRAAKTGVSHLGIQVDTADELEELNENVRRTTQGVRDEAGAHCCYAQSDKHWTTDPDGIIWELFHTRDSSEEYGKDGAEELLAREPTPQPTARSCC